VVGELGVDIAGVPGLVLLNDVAWLPRGVGELVIGPPRGGGWYFSSAQYGW